MLSSSIQFCTAIHDFACKQEEIFCSSMMIEKQLQSMCIFTSTFVEKDFRFSQVDEAFDADGVVVGCTLALKVFLLDVNNVVSNFLSNPLEA